MARKPRIDFASALYQVIPRGNRGQVIFHDEGDYEHYRRFLGSWPGIGGKQLPSISIWIPSPSVKECKNCRCGRKGTGLSKEP